MRRRTILKVLSGALATVSAAMVAIPGVGFLWELIARRDAGKSLVQRIARVRDLPQGKAVLVPVVGTRRDAWTTYPEETIGRVWVVRRSPDDADADGTEVDAFTSICPHLGCQIVLDSKTDRFVCPCHQAVFRKTGEPMGEQELGHRNYAPRGMDALESRIVADEESGDLWVEVHYVDFEQGLTRRVAKG
ncbi:MAG: ubiquinol-cytochrome c reductase iron-sulfur subunit [Pirellulaceae bacterium]